MSTQHSPGPWRALPEGGEEPRDGAKWLIVDATADRLTYEGHVASAWGDANAALIAAAPTLLAERNELLEALHGWVDNYELDDDCVCDRCKRYPATRALIARIEGPAT